MCDEIDQIDPHDVFVACFSEVDDSLSQWRGYCPPSFGYSLGFNKRLLAQIAARQGYSLTQCIYDPAHQKRVVAAWVKQLISYLNASVTDQGSVADAVRYHFRTGLNETSYAAAFAIAAATIKDPSFHEEREWRLISTTTSRNAVKLRPARSMLVRYSQIQLHLSKSNPLLQSICVGPTPHAELAAKSLHHLADDLAMRGGIKLSSIPFRDW